MSRCSIVKYDTYRLHIASSPMPGAAIQFQRKYHDRASCLQVHIPRPISSEVIVNRLLVTISRICISSTHTKIVSAVYEMTSIIVQK